MLSEQYLIEVRLRRDRVPLFAQYPFNLVAVRNLSTLKLHPKVTYIVGENGSGKSTLLEAIAVAAGFNAEGGSRHFQFRTRASHSELYKYLTLSRSYRRPRDGYFLRAESYFNLATNIEELDREPAPAPPVIDGYGGTSLHEQSHGESFFALFTNRLRGNGLYILDEPEAALSPQRQLALLSRLHALVLKQAQFIIATHSPIVMAYPNAQILVIGRDGLTPVAYQDTEHFRVMRDFMNRPEDFLQSLTAEDEK